MAKMNRIAFTLLFIACFTACNTASKNPQNAPDDPKPKLAPLSFASPSSSEIVNEATKLANELEIKTNKLGASIYGLAIAQIVENDSKFEFHSATDNFTFSYDNPVDAAKSRWGEIWMKYRRHWREQEGWLDHQHDLKISPGDFSLDAAKYPQTQEQWLAADCEVHIRLLYADTPEEIKKGTQRLRSCGQTCFEFAIQNKLEKHLRVFLYLDLYEPGEIGPNTRFSN